MNAAREAWFEGQLDLDPTRIVFIDETAANTKMARLYGRAPRGERCRAAVPHGHWKTTTFTAGLRYDGVAAPMVLEHFPVQLNRRGFLNRLGSDSCFLPAKEAGVHGQIPIH